MTKAPHPYDAARRLKAHEQNLAEADFEPAGDCSRCAALMCRLNVTSLAVVKAI